MARSKTNKLTDKEVFIMNLLWNHGPMYVREMLEYYPEPRPHFNTVSTTVRILEEKGYVVHQAVGSSYRYSAAVAPDDFRGRSLADVVRSYFNNSYKQVVSALVEDEKISVEELRELIELVESKKREKK